jgi:phage terminase small subunit
MARPNTPTAVLELNGAFRKNPDRRRTDPKPAGPLGSPPKQLDENQRAMWNELKRKAPIGVLTAADCFLLEIVCRLMTRVRFPAEVPLETGELAQLMQGLIRLGFTPADRSKLNLGKGKEGESNPFKNFTGAKAAR